MTASTGELCSSCCVQPMRFRSVPTAPYCKKRIPALRAELAQCPFCKKGDYRRPTEHVLENSVLFQGELLLLQSLGVPFLHINVPADMFSNSPLLSLRPADYFHLYRSMTGTLSHLFWPEDIPELCLKLGVLTQEEIAIHSMLYGASQAPEVVLFHTLFLRWPDNFFLFLDIAYRAFILGNHFEEVLRGFRTLFEEEFYLERHLPGSSWHTGTTWNMRSGCLIVRKRDALDTLQEWWDDLHKWQALREGRARQIEEREQVLRRHIQAMPPLSQRATPRQWEDLASVPVRSAQAMGYAHPKWILRPETMEYRVSAEGLLLLHRQLDYELLARLLNLDEATIHGLSLHRFAATIKGESTADTTNTQRYLRPSKLPQLWNAQRLFAYSGATIQVCPCCLDEPVAYDRIYWRATPVLLCPRHGVWLINTCPTCHQPIPALRPKLETCPFCGGDFRLFFPSYIQYRWNWLLTRKWQFITPDWLLDAFEEHEQHYRMSED